MTKLFSTPVGAGKRFLVLCDGKPFAGFDGRPAAAAYVAQQKEKLNHNKGGPAMAAKCAWLIKDRGDG
jgi:hypothetical protein